MEPITVWEILRRIYRFHDKDSPSSCSLSDNHLVSTDNPFPSSLTKSPSSPKKSVHFSPTTIRTDNGNNNKSNESDHDPPLSRSDSSLDTASIDELWQSLETYLVTLPVSAYPDVLLRPYKGGLVEDRASLYYHHYVFHVICACEPPVSILRWFINHCPACLELTDPRYGNLPLHFAIASKRTSFFPTLQLMIDTNPSILRRTNTDQRTPLHLFCMYGTNPSKNNLVDCIRYILDKDAKEYPSSSDGTNSESCTTHRGRSDDPSDAGDTLSLSAIPSFSSSSLLYLEDTDGNLPLHCYISGVVQSRHQEPLSYPLLQLLLSDKTATDTLTKPNRNDLLPLHYLANHPSLPTLDESILRLMVDSHMETLLIVDPRHPRSPFLRRYCEQYHPLPPSFTFIQYLCDHPSMNPKLFLGPTDYPLYTYLLENLSASDPGVYAILALIGKQVPEYFETVSELWEDYPLHIFCKQKKVEGFEIVRLAIECCPSALRIRNKKNKELPLHLAAHSSIVTSLDTLKLLVQNHRDGLKTRDAIGEIPLHYVFAATSKYPVSIETVQYFLDEYPGGLQIKNAGGELPLHRLFSPRYNHFPTNTVLMDYLLENYADFFLVRGRDDETILHYFLRREVPNEVLMKLIEKHPSLLSVPNKQHELPGIFACRYNTSLSVLQLLWSRNPECLRYHDPDGNNILHILCRRSRPLEILQYVCSTDKTLINERNEKQELPFHSLFGEALETVPNETLLFLVRQHPASLATKPSSFYTFPIHTFIKERIQDWSILIEPLLQQYPDTLLLKDDSGELPIHELIRTNECTLAMVQLMIEQKPEILLSYLTRRQCDLFRYCTYYKKPMEILSYVLHKNNYFVEKYSRRESVTLPLYCDMVSEILSGKVSKYYRDLLQLLLPAAPVALSFRFTSGDTLFQCLVHHFSDLELRDTESVTFFAFVLRFALEHGPDLFRTPSQRSPAEINGEASGFFSYPLHDISSCDIDDELYEKIVDTYPDALRCYNYSMELPIHKLCRNPNLSLRKLTKCVESFPLSLFMYETVSLPVTVAVGRDDLAVTTVDADPSVSGEATIPTVAVRKVLPIELCLSLLSSQPWSRKSCIEYMLKKFLDYILGKPVHENWSEFCGESLRKYNLPDNFNHTAEASLCTDWETVWVHLLQNSKDKDLYESILKVLQENVTQTSHMLLLAEAEDSDNRLAIDVAPFGIRKYMKSILYLCGRYEFYAEDHEHSSETSIVYIAKDHGLDYFLNTNEGKFKRTKTKDVPFVALKFMKHHSQFRQEIYARGMHMNQITLFTPEKFRETYNRDGTRSPSAVPNENANPPPPLELFAQGLTDTVHLQDGVLPIKAFYDSDQDALFGAHLASRNTHFGSTLETYPYLLVLPAAERSFQDIIVKEKNRRHWDKDLKKYIHAIIECLQDLHASGRFHGDIKPRNIVRLKDGTFALIDLDSSVKFNEYVPSKISEGYCPPEMMRQTLRQAKEMEPVNTTVTNSAFRTPSTSRSYPRSSPHSLDDLRASVAYDLWSLGMTVYFALTGSPFFKIDINDQLVDSEDYTRLATWDSTRNDTMLNEISDRSARNFVSRLLYTEPSKREPLEKLIHHPFLTGKDIPSRLRNEKPLFDVFVSYRDGSDLVFAKNLVQHLQSLGLKVWWDKEKIGPTENWFEAFVDGLANSRIIVPILTRNAIYQFDKRNHAPIFKRNWCILNKTSPLDNFLFEHRLAIELQDKEQGSMVDIFPVFLGDKDDISGLYGNFFEQECAPVHISPLKFGTEPIDSVELMLIQQLDRLTYGTRVTPPLSVQQIWNTLNRFNGYVQNNLPPNHPGRNETETIVQISELLLQRIQAIVCKEEEEGIVLPQEQGSNGKDAEKSRDTVMVNYVSSPVTIPPNRLPYSGGSSRSIDTLRNRNIAERTGRIIRTEAMDTLLATTEVMSSSSSSSSSGTMATANRITTSSSSSSSSLLDRLSTVLSVYWEL